MAFTLSSSSHRLLNFHNAHTSARVPSASCDSARVAKDLTTYSWPNAKCLHDMSDRTADLAAYLLQLDSKRRVDPTDQDVKSISSDIHELVGSIYKKLSDDHPIFAGRLLKMGSSHNGMKVIAPDEFDFSVELDLKQLLGGAAEFEGLEQRNGKFYVYLEFDGDPADFDIVRLQDEIGITDIQYITEILSANGKKDAPRYKSAVGKEGERFVLHTESIAFAFFNALHNVVQNFELPPHWTYGGFNRPHYSGLRLNMPAYTLQLEYHGTSAHHRVLVCVDIAPVLRIPGDHFRFGLNDVVWTHLATNDFMGDFWFRLECGTHKGAISSLAEEKWLATYEFESIAKTSIRVCKILHNMISLTSPRHMPRYIFEEIFDFQERKASGTKIKEEEIERIMTKMLIIPRNTGIPPLENLEDQYVTFRDIGENLCGHEFISSYIYKRLVMTLMVLDEQSGRHWTVNDLPEIVVSVFLIINDLIMSANQSTMIMQPVETRNHCEAADDTYIRISEPDMTERTFTLVTRSFFNTANTTIGGENSPRHVEQDQIFDEVAIPEPPFMYKKLQAVIRADKCSGIIGLFLKDHFSKTIKSVGLDDHIACVLETLANQSHEGRTVQQHLTEEETEEMADIKDCLVTKSEILKRRVQRATRLGLSATLSLIK